MSASSDSLVSVFAAFAADLETLSETRDRIRTAARPLESASRRLTATVQSVHTKNFLAPPHPDNDGDGEKAESPAEFLFRTGVEPVLAEVVACVADIRASVPDGEEARFSGMWSNSLQQLGSALCLLYWIRHRELLKKADLERMLLGSSAEEMDKGEVLTSIDVSDYLMCVANIPSELSRLCVNAVTFGDTRLPVEISKFVNELFAAFRVLNLKVRKGCNRYFWIGEIRVLTLSAGVFSQNDGLRRKYDGIKYDVKRIEEVVYDLSLRGMLQTSES
jgi:predicted translin family RNA/ssDNA-binding protein